jgi:hypothetical protein
MDNEIAKQIKAKIEREKYEKENRIKPKQTGKHATNYTPPKKRKKK